MIKELNKSCYEKWNKFVLTHSNSTFFHFAEWQGIIEKSFGHKTYYLYAENDGTIEGVYPLGHIKSLMFGNSLISTPFCVYGGVIANTAEAAECLEQAAFELAKKLKVNCLETRNISELNGEWHEKDLYVTFRRSMESDHDANMNAIPRKQRAMVRKGLASGMTYEIDQTIDRFYNAYAESVRNLGTPVFARRYFANIKEAFGDQCEILTVLYKNKLVSSVMSFYFKDEVLPYYGGGTVLARELKGNDYMYWQVMCRAAGRGCKIFDYGRSKQGTGSYSFKKNWGFEPEPLHYGYKLISSAEIPDINPLNPKYQFFIKIWKKLPVAIAKRLGPVISKNLG
ncbi:MAG: FemAB family PEP-CTERM system-associated protein [Gammaproteobacteria bacterium]|nr:FemAB family PEP-CTERM system-associated protein [Gammaproteobacteria bacterium]